MNKDLKKEMIEQKMISQDNKDLFEMVLFHDRDMILSQGQDLTDLYILMAGTIKVSHTTPNGITFLNSIVRHSVVIGEVELLNHCEVANTIIAIGEVICMKVNLQLHQKALMDDHFFIQYIAASMAKKLYASDYTNSLNTNYPVENRVASYLMGMEKEGYIEENMADAAELLGCSYRQLQRILKDFLDQNYLIKVKRGLYKINNRKALEDRGEDLYTFY